jgi:hypothetical protein
MRNTLEINKDCCDFIKTSITQDEPIEVMLTFIPIPPIPDHASILLFAVWDIEL